MTEEVERARELFVINKETRLDNSQYNIEDFIEACLRYHENDSNIAVGKLKEEK